MSKHKDNWYFYERLLEMTSGEKTPLELVNEADALMRKAWQSLDDPETLSKALFQLALKNSGLGDLLAETQDAERQAETQYKFLVDKAKLAYVKSGESATVAESKAKVDLKDKLDEWDNWKKNVAVLRIKRDDIDKVLDQGRTRVSLIKGDIKNESF